MRRALVVGIDHYTNLSSLHGCVNDAYSVKSVLERHGDGTVNFGVVLRTGTGPSDVISRSALKDGIQQLFADDSEIALLYFAGLVTSRPPEAISSQAIAREAMTASHWRKC